MEQYVINGSYNKFKLIEIGEGNCDNIKSSLVVAIMDRELNDRFKIVYGMVEKLIQNANRVILVGVSDNNKVFSPIANMMVTYRAYDIYSVRIKSVVSAEWIEKVCERHPDVNEVQTYLGGEVVVYNELSSMLVEIEGLCKSGNIAELKSYVEKNMPSLEVLTATVNKMKKTCDEVNTNELNELIADYKNRLDAVAKESSSKSQQLETLREENDKLGSAVSELKNTCSDLKVRLEDMQENDGGSVMRTYNTIPLSSINSHTKRILYFKEISYVPYVNSLVKQLADIAKRKLGVGKVKVVVYDTNTEFYQAYSPLRIVDGREYLSNKTDLVNKVEMFVVTEPNPTILSDVLNKEFELVIIYDRMRSSKDLISGNLITKYFVLNSNTEYVSYKSKLGIIDPMSIITRAHALKEKTLDIPTIDGYSGATPSAKMSKYIKQPTSHGDPLIGTIMKKARIEM